MAKLLRRHPVSGKLLRVPWSYPHAGKLFRGIPICIPWWEIAVDFGPCVHCPVVCEQASSVYTPVYLTVTFSGVIDCEDWCGGTIGAALEAAGKIVLPRYQWPPAHLCTWNDPSWGVENNWWVGVDHDEGKAAVYVYRSAPRGLAFYAAGAASDVRLGLTRQNGLTEGQCCDYIYGGMFDQWRVVAHSGGVQIEVGDTT